MNTSTTKTAARFTIVRDEFGVVDHATTLAAATRRADQRSRLNPGVLFLVQDEAGENLYESRTPATA